MSYMHATLHTTKFWERAPVLSLLSLQSLILRSTCMESAFFFFTKLKQWGILNFHYCTFFNDTS